MRFKLVLNGEEHEVDVMGNDVNIDGDLFKVEVERTDGHSMVKVERKDEDTKSKIDKCEYSLRTSDSKVFINDLPHSVEVKGDLGGTHLIPVPSEIGLAGAKVPKDEVGTVRPPMTGKVISIEIQEGNKVEKGALLVILEAMKMQNEILAPKKGKIKKILVDVGAVVSPDDVMIIIE